MQTSLLVFDPNRPGSDYHAALAVGSGVRWAAQWKRGVATLRLREYQLVACAGLLATAGERAASKVLRAAEVFVRRGV